MMLPGRPARRSRLHRLLRAVTTAAATACLATCSIPDTVPDQTPFAPLGTLETEGDAIVRLYAAPFPGLEPIAVHPWFVIKPAGSSTFCRWEVWPDPAEPFGHVRLNLKSPTEDVGAGGVHILAEIAGAQAEAIVTFIEENSPGYPCRNEYRYLPGPNSSTYAQWVLDQTGWNVALPWTAIGKDYPPVCPQVSDRESSIKETHHGHTDNRMERRRDGETGRLTGWFQGLVPSFSPSLHLSIAHSFFSVSVVNLLNRGETK